MIPQVLKWVGAVLAMVIAFVALVPLALGSMFDIVSFDDDSGLFSDDGLEEQLEGEIDDDLPDPTPQEPDPDEGDDEDEASDEEDEADEEEDDGPAEETYIVESGQTLYDIAEEIYGDGNRWREIAEANDLDDQATLTVGEELVIP